MDSEILTDRAEVPRWDQMELGGFRYSASLVEDLEVERIHFLHTMDREPKNWEYGGMAVALEVLGKWAQVLVVERYKLRHVQWDGRP